MQPTDQNAAWRERRAINVHANHIQCAIHRILQQIEGLRPQDGLAALLLALQQAQQDFDRTRMQ